MNSEFADLTIAEIDRQIAEIERIADSDKQRSYFAKYLVVFICGCLESIIESIMCEYVTKHRDAKIAKFVSESLHISFRNPDTDKIISLLGRFDDNWADEIRNMPNVNKKGIDGIITHKNELAHTGSSTITMGEIKDLYDRAKPVLTKIDSTVLS